MTRLPRLRISESNPHLLATEDGNPFWMIGDTAWELFHRLTRSEADLYFANRAAKGFNLVCAVVLAEFDGLHAPNAEGEVPLHNDDPLTPNEAYFKLVDRQIKQAEANGLYFGLLPTWGDKLTAPWGDGPRIFHADKPDVGYDYGCWLGERYKDVTNIVWILGGDRPPTLSDIPPTWPYPWEAGFTPETDWRPFWRAMAMGILAGTNDEALITYHPQGGSRSTSRYLHDEPWLSINMMQSGHGSGHDVPVWDWVQRDYSMVPLKPTLDAEPNYEDHPVNPWPTYDPANGYFRDYDVRKQCYRSILAGGCGVIYGHHSVWQFWDGSRTKINHADRHWTEAIDRPGAFQAGYLGKLLNSSAGFGLTPDQSLLALGVGESGTRVCAAVDDEGKYAFVYVPTAGQALSINMSRLAGPRVLASWFDPRLGMETEFIGDYRAAGVQEFTTPNSDALGAPDWLLILTTKR